MLGRSRTWLWAAGAWLVAGGLFHAGVHVWSFVLENGLIGLRDFASDAMKQAISFGPLRPSLWREFRLYSLSFALLLIFAGSIDLLLAAIRAPASVVRPMALFGTVFWTLAFVPFAFVDPVLTPIAVAAVSVPLHALVWLTASFEVESGVGGEAGHRGDRLPG